MTLMTPEQAVAFFVQEYPSRYASKGLELATLRVYDQIFNTIGAGFRTTEEFLDAMKSPKKAIPDISEKYLSGERLYNGYLKTETIDLEDRSISFPVIGSGIDELYSEDEKVKHPEVKYWVEFDPVVTFCPYPNFQRAYSMVWNVDIDVLSEEWLKEALWFYKKCKEFFEGPDSHLYSYAFPKEPERLAKAVQEYERFFQKYKNVDEKEYWNAVSVAYELEYRGDTVDFIKRRWENELSNIHEFLDETMAMLEQSLAYRHRVSKPM